MKVFIDTNIIQHSATTYRTMDIVFGSVLLSEPPVIHTIHKKPSENENLREEIECLPRLASRLKQVRATLIIDFNSTYFEVRKAGRFRSEYFYGSDIKYADRPPKFNTILAAPSWLNLGPTENHFHKFLHRLKDARLLELAKYAGA